MLPKSSEKLLERCRVCKSILGTREEHEVKGLSCNDCNATYWYYPGIDKPKAIMHKSRVKKSGCGCGRCGR